MASTFPGSAMVHRALGGRVESILSVCSLLRILVVVLAARFSTGLHIKAGRLNTTDS